MRIRTAFAAFVCLAACSLLVAQDTSRGGLLSSPTSSSSGAKSSAKSSAKASAKSSGTARRGIFDIATSSDAGKKSGSTASAPGRTTATTSPFGTTSSRTKSTGRRWKTNSRIADCIRTKAIPSNTNLSFSGTITNIVTDGRYVILTMFDSVETVAENGAKGDVPVTYTVVLDAESVAGNNSIKENAKQSFTVDSNYAYLVWNDSGCTVRAVDNALTEPDPASTAKSKR